MLESTGSHGRGVERRVPEMRCMVEFNYDDMLSRFHLIPERYGQTDGRTDGQICYINIARQYADAR